MYSPVAICPVTKPLSVALFKGLGNHEVPVIRAAAAKRTFEASQIIIRTEEPAVRLFVIEVGSVDYYIVTNDGQEVLLRRLMPGNAFGFATFLSEPIGYLGTARAARKTQTLVWEHRVARQLAENYPRLVENALHASLHYIAMYAKRHMRLVSNTAQERVAYALTNLGSRLGRMLPGGVEVDIKNEDLASLADVNFFTLSRILGAWERQKVVLNHALIISAKKEKSRSIFKTRGLARPVRHGTYNPVAPPFPRLWREGGPPRSLTAPPFLLVSIPSGFGVIPRQHSLIPAKLRGIKEGATAGQAPITVEIKLTQYLSALALYVLSTWRPFARRPSPGVSFFTCSTSLPFAHASQTRFSANSNFLG